MEKSTKSPLISAYEAENIILSELRDFGIEQISIEKALGRILASPLIADRDFPPFDRVTMDGIAINFISYQSGNREYRIQSTQSAGEEKHKLMLDNECIEVMTGADLPKNTDTIIRYEDLEITNGIAKILTQIKPQQNVHFKGEDRKKGTIIVKENQKIRSTEIAVAASIGAVELTVKKLPKIAIITSGDELVAIDKTPELHQIRSSNVYAIASILNEYGIESTKIHIQDDFDQTVDTIEKIISDFDVLILSGGVSMGKKDFIPKALENLGIEKLFHKIAQTPGKPIWFGKKAKKLVFALPGNPVSTYMCMVRYFRPWLNQSLDLKNIETGFAHISEDFQFPSPVTYFLQVKLSNHNGVLIAQPIKGHGSGDFANLVDADAFLELPAFERNEFIKGEVFKIWLF